MAIIRPFRGIRYNTSITGDLSKVICPPYDVISPVQQENYYHLSNYNYIRIEHNRVLPADGEQDNKYTRALATFEKWLDEGILRQETAPAMYIHDHYFTLYSEQYCRRSIISTVRLEEWTSMVIRPHEGTLPKARSDREMLLRALNANTSPVFMMYEDEDKAVSEILQNLSGSTPLLSFDGYENDRHDLWKVTREQDINRLAGLFESKPLYIADGHHRYESALKYRHEQEAWLGSNSGQEAFNYLMVEMVSITDPGLVILPPHRLIRGVNWQNINHLVPRLEDLFNISEFHLENTSSWNLVENFMNNSGQNSFALFGLGGDRVHVLSVKNQAGINQMMPAFHSELYRALDVSIIDHIILEGLLGLSDMTDLNRIAFNHNREEVLEQVNSGEYQLAVLLRTVKPDIIKQVADAGERMPRKSTYFYPKLPSGLVVNRLV